VYQRTHLVPLVVAAAVMLGCQSYTPVTLSSVPAGTSVRLSLTDRGRVALGQTVGSGVESLEGTVRTVDSGTVQLAVDRVRGIDGTDRRWNQELVTVPRDAVATASVRKVSIVRSALVAAGLAGGVLLVTSISGENGVGHGGSPPPGSTQ
jgi:hypothetical protein